MLNSLINSLCEIFLREIFFEKYIDNSLQAVIYIKCTF